jgi:hypothetical protein
VSVFASVKTLIAQNGLSGFKGGEVIPRHGLIDQNHGTRPCDFARLFCCSGQTVSGSTSLQFGIFSDPCSKKSAGRISSAFFRRYRFSSERLISVWAAFRGAASAFASVETRAARALARAICSSRDP